MLEGRFLRVIPKATSSLISRWRIPWPHSLPFLFLPEATITVEVSYRPRDKGTTLKMIL
jgi:hypothetical protein